MADIVTSGIVGELELARLDVDGEILVDMCHAAREHGLHAEPEPLLATQKHSGKMKRLSVASVVRSEEEVKAWIRLPPPKRLHLQP